MRQLGFSERRVAPNDFNRFNTDLAFWGDTAYQGQFNGFRILDVDNPRRPREILNYEQCGNGAGGGQGDVVVWGSVLVRAWDANAGTTQTCRRPARPAAASKACTSSTSATRATRSSSPASTSRAVRTRSPPCRIWATGGCWSTAPRRAPQCEGLDIVEVPLSRPEESEFLRFEFADRATGAATNFACHDTGVILGRANKVACAGGVGFAVWSIGGKDGGSRDNPRFLYNHVVPEIAAGAPNVDNPTGHSAAFSYDGETIIFGHEPGGGLQSRCKATGEPRQHGGAAVACRTTT